MEALYIKIDKSPAFAPDAKAVVRVTEGMSYKYWYVDGIADANNLCRDRGWRLVK